MDRGRVRLDIRPRAVNLYQADVDEIRARLRGGEPASRLAKEYGVSDSIVHNIGWGRYGDPPVWTRDHLGRKRVIQ